MWNTRLHGIFTDQLGNRVVVRGRPGGFKDDVNGFSPPRIIAARLEVNVSKAYRHKVPL
jgi:hypothetical protein